jgi:uncharacterized protein (TIGR02646 family)
MRPVSKGAAPRAYAFYGEAIADLEAAIGDFCSYCERQIETHLAIEHVQPKSRRKSLLNDWSNFLLGCVNCNSSKGKRSVTLDNFLWPDRDNTMRAFVYNRDGLVRVYGRLRQPNRQRAEATITLVGLDKVPGHPVRGRRPTQADHRWRRRQEAFDLAERERDRLALQDTPVVRDLIADVAHGRGMFSIWMQVFAGDSDMRRRLRQRFIGTDAGSFDANEVLRRRMGGLV